MSRADNPEGTFGHSNFATTHWSVLLEARQENSPRASDALAKLCQTYWYPLYAYVRRHGHNHHEAQDLTQEFFARLLSRSFLTAVDQERGKFRWFLLCALKRFLANEWEREHAAKRGGWKPRVFLDAEGAEGRYREELVNSSTPEILFDLHWGITLLEEARQTIQREYAESGRGAIFDQLKVFLSGDRAALSRAEAGTALGLSEGAVKVAVHRLRQRYRECLRQIIARTVLTPAEVDEEIRYLFSLFSR
jgi:DNA-directed RNA polymerase specialized sigma24 family protein